VLLGVAKFQCEFLLDDFDEFARPKEGLEHRGGELRDQHAHKAEETFTDGVDLLFQQRIVELKLLVRRQEADLRDDEQFENKGFLDFIGEARFVFEHALGDVTEEIGFLPKDGPVLFA